MVEILIYLFFTIVGIGALMTGLIAFGYAIYGMSVSGFDKSVRNFCFGIGVIGFIIAIGSYYFINHQAEPENDHLLGTYQNINNKNQAIKLKKDGTFDASSELFIKTKGKWELIDDDEFYKIQILSEDDRLLYTLDIIQSQNQMILKTDNQFTNVENQLELKKL